MEKNVVWFREVDHEDLSLVGGKGANLGELTKIGIPVPQGFIVTSSAYYRFMEETKLIPRIKMLLKDVKADNSELLAEAAELIKKTIAKEKMPVGIVEEIKSSYRKLCGKKDFYVAVRSSATSEDSADASFAGQQRTYLNIIGEEDVVRAVQGCWASLFEPRAIFYRMEKKYDHFKMGIAVPVQQMVQSEVSGIMFTIDPVTNDKGKIIVEAVYGLGEMIVGGAVNPDHFEVNKNGFELASKQIGNQAKQMIKVGEKTKVIPVSRAYQSKQKISNQKIIELAKIGKKIENHYLFPQDIEWAYNNSKLYIVQTRPVTTTKVEIAAQTTEEAVKESLQGLKILLSGSPASPGITSGPVKIIHSPSEINKVKKGDVLVTEMTTPDFVPAMKRASAIVTDKGGRTCHAAIVSRELGIPCVVGTDKATAVLKNDQMITVYATEGRVYSGVLKVGSKYPEKAPEIDALIRPIVQTKIKTATKVYVNLGEPELVTEIAKKNVDGVGLLRAEFMIAEIGTHPKKLIEEKKSKVFVNKLTEGLKTFCEAFDPRPVIYRATDFKSNEYKNLIGGAKYETDEPNPMIGYRGCFRYISDPEVFNLELEAIKKVRNQYELKNLWLMIPFVRTVKEMAEVKKLVSSVGLHRSPSFKLLMMAEIPSNVILIDKFLDLGIDGVSIGSNDLTMLTLGVDRDNSKIASEFSELDESVLWSLERLVTTCRKRGAMVSICGQAPSVYPELTEKLVHWGATSVSVSPDVIDKTRQVVAEAEAKLVRSKK
ncbi:MAG: phosphoenolpyruvate synthase [Patescibacteria group bacterium]|nr:phosphoenolpyruvate synthase [Patescibacteria group bacterium]